MDKEEMMRKLSESEGAKARKVSVEVDGETADEMIDAATNPDDNEAFRKLTRIVREHIRSVADEKAYETVASCNTVCFAISRELLYVSRIGIAVSRDGYVPYCIMANPFGISLCIPKCINEGQLRFVKWTEVLSDDSLVSTMKSIFKTISSHGVRLEHPDVEKTAEACIRAIKEAK